MGMGVEGRQMGGNIRSGWALRGGEVDFKMEAFRSVHLMPKKLNSSRVSRVALSIAAMAAVGVLTGCPPQPPPLSTTRPAVRELAREEAPSLGTQPVTG